MNRGADFRNVRSGAMESVIYHQAVALRQLIQPTDRDRTVALDHYRGTGHGSFEPPDKRRGQIAVQLLTKFGHRDSAGSRIVAIGDQAQDWR